MPKNKKGDTLALLGFALLVLGGYTLILREGIPYGDVVAVCLLTLGGILIGISLVIKVML